jgi:hypothetical protein
MKAFLSKIFNRRKPIAVIVFPFELWNTMDDVSKQQWQQKLEKDYHVFMYSNDRYREVEIKIYSTKDESI